MKVLKKAAEGIAFQLGKREAGLLRHLVDLYPRLPADHQKLSRGGALPDLETGQKLLEEALVEQRQENKQLLQRLLADPQRFQSNAAGAVLSLSSADIEWVLQVLNDIRVGSWALLGCPEERFEHLNETTAPDLWAMETAGYFQMHILEALTGGA